MRTAPAFAGVAMVLVAAGVVMAASPSPSPSATPKPTPAPTAMPAPSATPTPTAKPVPSAGSAAATSWSATIAPLNATTGTATVSQAANGTGTISVTLKGLGPDAPWTVDVESGTSTSSRDAGRHEIAFRSGVGIDRVSSDTVRISLTASEMKALLRYKSASGVAVLVSDGTNRSAAVFAAG